MNRNIDGGVSIYGTEGYMIIPVFWKPTKVIVVKESGDLRTYDLRTYDFEIPLADLAYEDEGYQFEIRHVNECIRENKTESDIVTFDTTLRILKQCDSLRKDWGLKYPCEDSTM